jgi:hypothetical protein
MEGAVSFLMEEGAHNVREDDSIATSEPSGGTLEHA